MELGKLSKEAQEELEEIIHKNSSDKNKIYGMRRLIKEEVERYEERLTINLLAFQTMTFPYYYYRISSPSLGRFRYGEWKLESLRTANSFFTEGFCWYISRGFYDIQIMYLGYLTRLPADFCKSLYETKGDDLLKMEISTILKELKEWKENNV